MRLGRDDVLGLGAIVTAAAYWAAADRIPVSLLADVVGADGVPKVLAVALGICGALLVLSSRLRPASAPSAETDPAETRRAHRRAAILLAGLAGYVTLLPLLGYATAIALLLAGAAVYGGTAIGPRVAVVAAAGSAVFWIFFVKVLGVDMPTGFWTSGF